MSLHDAAACVIRSRRTQVFLCIRKTPDDLPTEDRRPTTDDRRPTTDLLP
jgi:hypothetical protein